MYYSDIVNEEMIDKTIDFFGRDHLCLKNNTLNKNCDEVSDISHRI